MSVIFVVLIEAVCELRLFRVAPDPNVMFGCNKVCDVVVVPSIGPHLAVDMSVSMHCGGLFDVQTFGISIVAIDFRDIDLTRPGICAIVVMAINDRHFETDQGAHHLRCLEFISV